MGLYYYGTSAFTGCVTGTNSAPLTRSISNPSK